MSEKHKAHVRWSKKECVCVCVAISNVKLKGISAKCQRHIVKHDYLIRKHFLPGSCWQPAAQFPCCHAPLSIHIHIHMSTSVCVCVSLLMNFAIALKFMRVFNNLTKSSHLLYKIPFSFGPTDPPSLSPTVPYCYSPLLYPFFYCRAHRDVQQLKTLHVSRILTPKN